MKQAAQAYPDNPGPIHRIDGSYVYYDMVAAGTTSRPWLPGHRGWGAVGPDWESLGYFPRRWRHGGQSRLRALRKYKTAMHALAALDRWFPLTGDPDGLQIASMPAAHPNVTDRVNTVRKRSGNTL